MDLGIIFITGLTVGGFTCMAVQGGLLASAITARPSNTLWPTVAFLAAKFLAYILLGFILGAFGGVLTLSDKVRTYMQLAAGFYMIAIALDLLKVHPIFRYAVIQPPKFIFKFVKNQSKNKNLFAPAFLGTLTIFLPCGTTLAMEALAIASGSAVKGAVIMGAFIAGTTPLFFGLGFITTVLGDTFKKTFFKVAAVAVLYLGLSSINGSLTALGAPLTFQTVQEAIPIEINLGSGERDSSENQFVKIVNGVQVVDIQVLRGGYNPNSIQVKSGLPIRLNLSGTGAYSCASSFTIPQLDIYKRVPRTGTVSLDLPAQNPGKLNFTCAMGMYSGVVEVI